jgi:hypothetical protein
MTDLRPEALLALADRLQSGVDDPMWADHCEMSKRTCGLAAATLRALAAQSAQMSPESEQWTDEQFQRECIRRCISAGELLGYTAKSAEQIAAKRAAPSQPMAGEPLPPLPEPDVGLGVHRWAYSDMQMRDYATAATEALRQRVAELEQLLKVMERQYADALERFQKMQQTDEAEFDVHIDGEYYASTCGPREDAWREAMHYVSQESPGSEMEVFEVFRLPIRFPIGEDK